MEEHAGCKVNIGKRIADLFLGFSKKMNYRKNKREKIYKG